MGKADNFRARKLASVINAGMAVSIDKYLITLLRQTRDDRQIRLIAGSKNDSRRHAIMSGHLFLEQTVRAKSTICDTRPCSSSAKRSQSLLTCRDNGIVKSQTEIIICAC